MKPPDENVREPGGKKSRQAYVCRDKAYIEGAPCGKESSVYEYVNELKLYVSSARPGKVAQPERWSDPRRRNVGSLSQHLREASLDLGFKTFWANAGHDVPWL